MSAVTVPEDKLAELQRKAGMVDELVYVLEEVNEFLNFAWRDIEMNDYSFTLLEEVICKVQRQIAKAKEQSCSTLCHPEEEEECFITENGKCKAKGK